jgi:hypothetical protein
MTTDFNKLIDVDGAEYRVVASHQNHHGHFQVQTSDGVLIEDTCGCVDVNPLCDLWRGHVWFRTHGAARASMELKCIKNAVRESLKVYNQFLIESTE